MCGFCCYYGKGLVLDELRKGTENIAYRGPDDTNYLLDEDNNIFIGFNRLSIIDDKGGKQPMISPCKKYILVFNGEIYNSPQIRNVLKSKSVQFKTKNSDTEVILQAYIYWGEKFVNKLDGMFSICIFDLNKNKCFISRDMFGEKPLYYFIDRDRFIVASQINSITPFLRDVKLNKDSIKQYFILNFVPSPNTIYKNIFKVKKSELLEINLHNLKVKYSTYYRIEKKDFNLKNENEIINHLDYLLDKSVKSRMLTDSSLGILLSGGVDSTLISLYAKKYNDSIISFTADIEDKEYNESLKAAKVSNFLGIKNYKVKINSKNYQKNLLEVFSLMDEPLGAPSLLPTYMVSKLASKKVKSVLGGDGGDEIFGGYEQFKYVNIFENLKFLHTKTNLLNFFHNIIKFFPKSNKNLSFDFKFSRFLRGYSSKEFLRNTLFLSSLDIDDLEQLFNEQIIPEDLFKDIHMSHNENKDLNNTDKTTLYYLNYYLPDLVCSRADRGGMINSLEIRSPLINKDIIEFIFSLEEKHKYNLFDTKPLLKKVLKNKLAGKKLDISKAGLTIPIQDWITKDSFKSLNSNNYFKNDKYFEDLIHNHFNKKNEYRNFIFSKLSLDNLNL